MDPRVEPEDDDGGGAVANRRRRRLWGRRTVGDPRSDRADFPIRAPPLCFVILGRPERSGGRAGDPCLRGGEGWGGGGRGVATCTASRDRDAHAWVLGSSPRMTTVEGAVANRRRRRLWGRRTVGDPRSDRADFPIRAPPLCFVILGRPERSGGRAGDPCLRGGEGWGGGGRGVATCTASRDRDAHAWVLGSSPRMTTVEGAVANRRRRRLWGRRTVGDPRSDRADFPIRAPPLCFVILGRPERSEGEPGIHA